MKNTQINEDEKKRAMQLLTDMFYKMSIERIQRACEQYDWNVDQCIDELLSANNEDSPILPESKFQRGAVPKMNRLVPSLPKHNDINKNNRNSNHTKTNSALSPIQSKIIEQIQSGFRVMIIMRGAPGSGKSHLARTLFEQCVPLSEQYQLQEFVLSTDDFFYNNSGKYNFNVNRLDEAHTFNQNRARNKAIDGWSPLFIDNTNMQLWEMMPYVQIAVRNGYLLQILEPNTPWRQSAGKLAMRNTHKVPREQIQRMLDKYEKANVQDLLQMLKETKYTKTLPQFRTHPPVNIQKSNSKPKVKEKPEMTSTKLSNNFQTPKKSPPKKTAQSFFGETPYKDTSNDNSNSNNLPSQRSLLDLLKEDNNFLDTRSAINETEKFNSNPLSVRPGLIDFINHDYYNEAPLVSNFAQMTIDQSNSELQRHQVNCPNEDKDFILLRQVYPNKNISMLWNLFVENNGEINPVIDKLIKDDECCESKNCNQFSFDVTDTFRCACDKNENATINNPKPQRQRARFMSINQQPKQQHQEEELPTTTIQSSFVIEPNKDFLSSIPDCNEIRETCGTVDCETLSGTNRKNSIEIETQTEPIEDNHDDSDRELLEIILDQGLIEQLNATFKSEAKFGGKFPETSALRVFMPRSLAKEIYMLWMESVYNQMEVQRLELLREDEQFARLLKHPKYENYTESPANTSDLLDMELAWLTYKNELNSYAEEKNTDLATHLTHMKLCETFPQIPRDAIIQIFAANNNQYSETVDMIRGMVNVDINSKPTLTQNQMLQQVQIENELVQQRKQQHQTKTNNSNGDYSDTNYFSHSKDGSVTSNSTSTEAKRTTIHEFEEMRNLAAHHCQLRAECHNKAKDAIQRNNHTVALYYSQIASLHKNKIDYFNSRAANSIMDVHSLEQNNPDLLDLHYLHVAEAVVCLDIFLDRHITVMRSVNRTYKNVFIITGRGLHSIGGVSTIKNRVKHRLKERSLRWAEMNPGLLKVKVYSSSRYSASK